VSGRPIIPADFFLATAVLVEIAAMNRQRRWPQDDEGARLTPTDGLPACTVRTTLVRVRMGTGENS
jgi:hypothetical protein